MDEHVIRDQPKLLCWPGPKRKATVFSATRGRLVLTTERLVFAGTGKGGSLSIPLLAITRAELGKGKALVVRFTDGPSEDAATFALQQLRMPDGEGWVGAIAEARAALVARGAQGQGVVSPLPPLSPPAPLAPLSPPSPDRSAADGPFRVPDAPLSPSTVSSDAPFGIPGPPG